MAEGLPPAAGVFSVVDAATSWLRGEPEATSASIRLPPDCFSQPGSAALENALHRAGWRLDQADVNHHLGVGPPAHLPDRARRNQAQGTPRGSSGPVPRLARPVSRPQEFDHRPEDRRSRGHPMTMAWPQVEALAGAFPDRVHLLQVIQGGTISRARSACGSQ